MIYAELRHFSGGPIVEMRTDLRVMGQDWADLFEEQQEEAERLYGHHGFVVIAGHGWHRAASARLLDMNDPWPDG